MVPSACFPAAANSFCPGRAHTLSSSILPSGSSGADQACATATLIHSLLRQKHQGQDYLDACSNHPHQHSHSRWKHSLLVEPWTPLLQYVYAGLPNPKLKYVYAGCPNAHQEGRSDRACFSRTGASPPAPAHQQLPQGVPSAASAESGTSACMTCMVQPVLAIHVREAQVHLPRLPLSATKTSLGKLLLHRHPWTPRTIFPARVAFPTKERPLWYTTKSRSCLLVVKRDRMFIK